MVNTHNQKFSEVVGSFVLLTQFDNWFWWVSKVAKILEKKGSAFLTIFSLFFAHFSYPLRDRF